MSVRAAKKKRGVLGFGNGSCCVSGVCALHGSFEMKGEIWPTEERGIPGLAVLQRSRWVILGALTASVV